MQKFTQNDLVRYQRDGEIYRIGRIKSDPDTPKQMLYSLLHKLPDGRYRGVSNLVGGRWASDYELQHVWKKCVETVEVN